MLSLRDSIIKPDELALRLQELNQNAIAITDHGTSLGGVSIYKLLKKNSIKYIHGCEFYICDDTKIKDKDNKYFHLVVLCKDETGRLNMNQLITKSNHADHKYGKPRIDFEMLKQHSSGLIILSACLAGEISRALARDDYTKAKGIALRYKSQFGEDYYLEIQSRNDADQISMNKKIKQLADTVGVECVVTTDAHYILKEDSKYQNKYAFNGSYIEAGETYKDCYIQSEEEVRTKLYYFPKDFISKVISNTEIIAEKCNVEMPLSPPIMPHVTTPPEFISNKEWLTSVCKKGFIDKLNIDIDKHSVVDSNRTKRAYDETGKYLGDVPMIYTSEEIETYIDRFYYELTSLDKMNFIDYILLVYTYANIAKRRGIARGSGGGSLINYVSNITDIDPIEHNLYFERFIDVGSLSLLESGEITPGELKIPDIDLDFSGECCVEVLEHLYAEHGDDRVASIGKFGTNQTKGAIRDMCKVLDIDLETADKIAKSFANHEIKDVDNMIVGVIPIEGNAKDAISYVKKYPELFDYVRKTTGLPKSFGLHPCGKIVGTRDLDYYLPSCYDSNGIRYLQGDMHDVEDVGLVKIDVLGLRTIDQEFDTLEMSGESTDFINPKQSYQDPKVLDIFRSGDTVGIFQMSSYGMKQTLKKMNVTGIDDISVANALYRPGAMAYIDNFCNRRNGTESFEFLHPDLEPILKSTYGIIVFQEQLIEIGRLAGMRNPDLIRRATAKKNPELLNQVKPELEAKLKVRGWSGEQFAKLWEDMLAFAKYSFNKAHSSAYGIIAYMTAKQKAYYPAEFYAGLCNSYIGESGFVKDNAKEIFDDIERHRILLAKFDYKQDHRRCSVQDGKIVYAIPLIKECNKKVAETLYDVRSNNMNFFELVKILLSNKTNRKQIEILVKLGFFAAHGNAKELVCLLDAYEFLKYGEAKRLSKGKCESVDFIHLIRKYSRDKNKDGTISKDYIFTDMGRLISEIEVFIKGKNIDDYSLKEKISLQQEVLGFINLTTGRNEDLRRVVITKIYPLIAKRDGLPWAYSVSTKSIKTGKLVNVTVKANLFSKKPLQVLDVIYAKEMVQNDKGYWYLHEYQKIS